MWKPVMPSFAFTMRSKVLSDIVNSAWPPNIAFIISLFSALAHLMNSAFSSMDSMDFCSPSRSETS